MATAFERDFGDRTPPWGDYSDKALEWVGELLAFPPDAPYRDWMFQHPDGHRWIGYRAGTLIVDRAMAVSGQTAPTLVRSEAREILAMAGF